MNKEIESKYCTYCGLDHFLTDDFWTRTDAGNFSSICKKKKSDKWKKWSGSKPDNYLKNKAKERYEKNKDKFKARSRAWKEKNKTYVMEYSKKQYQKNAEKNRKEAIKRNKKRNPNSVREYNRNYFRKRRQDPKKRLLANLRTRISMAARGKIKGGKTIDELGCSWTFFISYIEGLFKPGMCWENYGEWEIDHIYPVSRADLSDPVQFRKICNYSNLQPLWRHENIKKFNHIPEE